MGCFRDQGQKLTHFVPGSFHLQFRNSPGLSVRLSLYVVSMYVIILQALLERLICLFVPTFLGNVHVAVGGGFSFTKGMQGKEFEA